MKRLRINGGIRYLPTTDETCPEAVFMDGCPLTPPDEPVRVTASADTLRGQPAPVQYKPFEVYICSIWRALRDVKVHEIFTCIQRQRNTRTRERLRGGGEEGRGWIDTNRVISEVEHSADILLEKFEPNLLEAHTSLCLPIDCERSGANLSCQGVDHPVISSHQRRLRH